MFKPLFTILAVAVLSAVVCAAVQQKRVVYGPVVKAFLSGLEEEVTELEFMIRHQEVSRADYERTKQRLAILRRYVERITARSREDRVPDLRVLADDELNALKVNSELQPNELRVGEEVGGQWKLVSIERIRNRFFVLERLSKVELNAQVPERKLSKDIDLRDVIETIIVREESAEEKTPQQITGSAAANVPSVEPATAKPVEAVASVPAKPQPQNPRLLHIYLPEYTDKAREKKIEGEIVVRASFQRDGKVKNVKVEKSLGFGLDDRAVAAVKRLGFLPAELNGLPVDSTAQVIFNFKLEKVTIYLNAAEPVKEGKP